MPFRPSKFRQFCKNSTFWTIRRAIEASLKRYRRAATKTRAIAANNSDRLRQRIAKSLLSNPDVETLDGSLSFARPRLMVSGIIPRSNVTLSSAVSGAF